MSIYVTDENGELYPLSGGSVPSENKSNISDDAAKYYENIYEAANKNLISHYYDDCIVTNGRQTIGVLTERQLGASRSVVLEPILQLRPISEIPSKVHYDVDKFEMIDGNAVEYDMRFFNLEKNTKYTMSFSTYINWADTTMFGVTIPVDDTSEHTVEFTTNSHGEYIFEHGFKMLPNEDYAMAVYQFEQICLVKGDYAGLSIQSGDVVTTVDVEVTAYKTFKRAKKYTDDVGKNKVTVIEGKSLSTNDYTNEDKNKLADINIQSIDFAETERQKSKNLFNINNFASELTGGVSITQTEQQITFTSTDVPGWFGYKIPVVIGKQYTISVETLSYTTNGLFIGNSAHRDEVSYGVLTRDVKTLTITANTDYLYVKGYVTYNFVGDTFTIDKLQLEEGTVATDYQPYGGGQIARFGDIADVEHVDVLYDVEGGKTTLGGRDYGSGIGGGITVENLDLSKYTYLDFTVTFTGSIEMTIRMDLTTAFTTKYWVLGRCGTEDTKLNDASERVPVNNVYLTSIVVNKSKTSISHENIGYFIGATGEYTNRDASVDDGGYITTYSIKRIEGVY